MTIERLRQLATAEDRTVFDYEFSWPRVPKPDVPRLILVLLASTTGFGLMAVYGDTIVAGAAGRLIALSGILGVVVVFPALVSRCIGRGAGKSFLSSDGESDRFRR